MPRRRNSPLSYRLLRCAAVLALTAGIYGCRGGGGPAGLNPVLAGNWSGTAKAGLVRFRATFTGASEAIGGAGHFTSPIASDDFSVQGTVTGTTVSLILTSSELGATTFIGRFTGADRVEGILDLGGGDKLALTIFRD